MTIKCGDHNYKLKNSNVMKTLQINLQETMFYFDKPEICNSIAAVFHEHLNILLMSITYKEHQEEILLLLKIQFKMIRPTILWTDSFSIDSWDNKILGSK